MEFHSNRHAKNICSVLNKLNTTVLIASLLMSAIACLVFIYFSAVSIMTHNLENQSETAAKQIEWIVKTYKTIAQGIGSIPELATNRTSTVAKGLILANKSNEYKLVRCTIIKTDGYSDMDTIYHGDRDCFKTALNGKVMISDPIVSKTDGKIALVIGSPIWRNGIYNGTVESVLMCYINPDILTDNIKNLNVSKKSNVYIIGKEGKTIASLDQELILNGHSNIKLAETDRKYRKLSEFEQDSLDGKRKINHIFRGGILHCYSSCLIEGTPGWAIIIDSPVTDYLGIFWIAFAFIFTMSVIIIFISRYFIRRHSKYISGPVESMASRLRQAAVGDFKSEIDYDDSLEEIKIIADATQILISRMDAVLNGISSASAHSGITEFIDFTDYNPVIDNYEKTMKVHLSLFDADMNKIMGSINDKSSTTYSSIIMVNGKAIGKYVISPSDDCIMANSSLQILVDNLSMLIGRIIENTISREIRYKAWQKNELINNEKLFKDSLEMSKRVLEWTSEIKTIGQNSGIYEIKNAAAEFEREAVQFNSNIQGNYEFSNFTNFNFALNEKDYQHQYLIENIEIRAGREVHKKDNITISSREKPEETLFGDHEAIEKVVIRILLYLEKKNPGSYITVLSSVNKETFGNTLNFKFLVENCSLTQNDIEKIRNMSIRNSHQRNTVEPDELKLLAAYNLLWLMNGSIRTISTTEDSLELMMVIPQL